MAKLSNHKPSYRQDKVASMLTEALSRILDERRSFMNVPILTINHIKMSADLKIAHVYFSYFEIEQNNDQSAKESESATDVEDSLNKHSKILRRELANKVYLKSVPSLVFHKDALLSETNKMLKIIDSISSAHKSSTDIEATSSERGHTNKGARP